MSSFYSFYNISIKKQENNSLLWFNILPFVTIPLNLLTISLFFQQSLRKIPRIWTPCLFFSPHQLEFCPLSKQNLFNLIFLYYPFPKIWFPSSKNHRPCRNLRLGADCSRSSPVLNPQMDCKDQRLRFIFLLSLVRVFVFFFLLWVNFIVFEEFKVVGCADSFLGTFWKTWRLQIWDEILLKIRFGACSICSWWIKSVLFCLHFHFEFLHIFYSFRCILFSNGHLVCNVFLLSHWLLCKEKKKWIMSLFYSFYNIYIKKQKNC